MLGKRTTKYNNISFFWHLLKLNIIPFLLSILFFFALPLLLRQYYIIPLYIANLLKAFFFFLFELLYIPIAIGTLLIKKNGKFSYLELIKLCKKRFLDALLFSFFKSFFTIISLYFFRQEWSELTSFLGVFLYFSHLLTMLYIPSILACKTLEYAKTEKKKPCCLFFASFLASSYIFFAKPFYTSFMFLCTFFLIVLSILTLNIIPSFPIIFYLLNRALHSYDELRKCMN